MGKEYKVESEELYVEYYVDVNFYRLKVVINNVVN